MVERIAQCGESRRGDVGAWEGLVALGGGELHDPVLHCENGVAACDLPLTVSAVTGEAIADLDGTENAARRAQHYRSVVLNWALMRAPAQLGASHLRLLAGQMKEHVYPMRPQVPEAAAAGLGGIEHPSAIPGLVARRSRPVEPDVDVRQRAKAPHSEQLAGARREGRVALGQRDGDKRIEPGRLGSYRLHLSRVDPHRLLHQKRIALIKQVVRDRGHLPVPPERHNEVGAGLREHLSVVREGWWAPDFRRSSRDETGIGGLDGDQLHVRHGDEVAGVAGVVKRVPVAYLDRGDADRHGVLFMDARSLRQCAPYCVNLRQPWKGGPDIAGPAASVDGPRLIRMAIQAGPKSRRAAVSCRTLACYPSDGQQRQPRTIQVYPKDTNNAKAR